MRRRSTVAVSIATLLYVVNWLYCIRLPGKDCLAFQVPYDCLLVAWGCGFIIERFLLPPGGRAGLWNDPVGRSALYVVAIAWIAFPDGSWALGVSAMWSIALVLYATWRLLRAHLSAGQRGNEGMKHGAYPGHPR